MSGFESAIRNAIARAPDGRPQTRQRIYDAARASLERNLARVEMPDADARRATLELTVERIEEEWRAITMPRDVPPARVSPDPAPADPAPPSEPASGPSLAPTTDPTMVPSEGATTASTTVSTADTLTAHGPRATGAGTPSVGDKPREVAVGAPATGDPGPVEPASVSPTTPDTTEPIPTEPAVTASAPPAQAEIVRTQLDPMLAEQLAARDDAMGGGIPTLDPVPTSVSTANVSTATPIEPIVATDAIDGRTSVMTEGGPIERPALDPSRESDVLSLPEAETGAVPEVGPAVEPPAGTPAPSAKANRSKARPRDRKAVKRKRGAATAREAKTKPRGRWVSRIASVALLVGVAALGWRWLDGSGMLDEDERDRVIVTVERGGATTTPSEPTEWTALMTRELAGAVEPVAGQDALRVTGPAEVALDAEALAGLGPNVSVSLLVRAVGEPGQAAVSCDFAGGGCGRLRFTLPREAEERVVTATIADGDEARLVLDPDVGGETAAFDLLGVTARSR